MSLESVEFWMIIDGFNSLDVEKMNGVQRDALTKSVERMAKKLEQHDVSNNQKISDLAFGIQHADNQQEMFDKAAEIMVLASELEIEEIYEFEGEVGD